MSHAPRRVPASCQLLAARSKRKRVQAVHVSVTRWSDGGRAARHCRHHARVPVSQIRIPSASSSPVRSSSPPPAAHPQVTPVAFESRPKRTPNPRRRAAPQTRRARIRSPPTTSVPSNTFLPPRHHPHAPTGPIHLVLHPNPDRPRSFQYPSQCRVLVCPRWLSRSASLALAVCKYVIPVVS